MTPRRGFAAMRPEVLRAYAVAGGRAVQREGTGHRYTADSARAAGLKSGRVRRARKLVARG